MLNIYVTDTQALVKYFTGKHIIKHDIHDIFMNVEQGHSTIYVPSTVIFEIAYLFEKGRIPVSLHHLQRAFATSPNLIEYPIDMTVIKYAFEIKDIPELHDRLIAGTAKLLNVPILTNDPDMIASQFVTCV